MVRRQVCHDIMTFINNKILENKEPQKSLKQYHNAQKEKMGYSLYHQATILRATIIYIKTITICYKVTIVFSVFLLNKRRVISS